jgi:hypothetical protein
MDTFMTSHWLRILAGLGIGLAVVGGPGRAAAAADTDPCKPSGASVTDAYKLGDQTTKEYVVDLGQKVAVELDKPTEFLAEAACRKKSIVLYVNGQATGNILAGLTGPQNNTLVFFLRQAGATHEFWNLLLGRPDFDQREIRIGVGIEGQTPLPIGDQNLHLTVFPVFAVGFWALVFALLAAGFFALARKSTILRDQLLDPDSAGQLGAYSLSKLQGAWWFFVILAMYLLIGIVTGDFSNSINSTALILLGIGAGTVMGSAAIDASKIEQKKIDLKAAKDQRTALAAATAGIAAADTAAVAANAAGIKVANAKIDALNGKSVNLLEDILSDGNGLNFHRFQLAAWTVVLSIIFIGQAYADLAMPIFNQTLMGLLGLSAGTYLGLKIPEPTKPTG